jgi:acetyl-CoA carboxylase biotin carboxyl carrier protein
MSVAIPTPNANLAISSSERAIVSPMIGTFYRRPSPNSPPFVEVGDSVEPTTDVCIVEVMKLLNTIPAECVGKVSRILVEDGESIEVGQVLMVIELT